MCSAVISAVGTAVLSTDLGGRQLILRLLIAQGRVSARFGGFDSSITCVAISSTGDKLAAAIEDGHVYVWDTMSPTFPRAIAHKGVVSQIGFITDDRVLYTVCEDNLFVYDMRDFAKSRCLHSTRGPITAVASCTLRSAVAVATADRWLQMWAFDCAGGVHTSEADLTKIAESVGVPNCLLLSPFGSTVVAGSGAHVVVYEPVDVGFHRHTLFDPDVHDVSVLKLCASERKLAVGTSNGTVATWMWMSGGNEWTLLRKDDVEDPVADVVWAIDEIHLLVATTSGAVVVIEIDHI